MGKIMKGTPQGARKRIATGTELADRMAMLAVATPRPHFQARPNIYFS
jgi:hypothetical protein